jgi:hypothetical protein
MRIQACPFRHPFNYPQVSRRFSTPRWMSVSRPVVDRRLIEFR